MTFNFYPPQVQPNQGSNPWPPDHGEYISCPWDSCLNHCTINPESAEFLKIYWLLELKTLMVGHGGSSAGSYLTDPTFPIPSHCASIVATSTLRVKDLCYQVIAKIQFQCVLDSHMVECSMESFMHKDYRSQSVPHLSTDCFRRFSWIYSNRLKRNLHETVCK